MGAHLKEADMLVHTQTGPYMPKSDAGKRLWMESFIASIARQPDRLGIDDRMFEYYQRVVRTFVEALQRTKNPAQGGPAATHAKNAARKQAVAVCRQLAMMFKNDPSMTDAQKIGLGLHVDVGAAKRTKRPGTFPQLMVQGAASGGHRIRFKQTRPISNPYESTSMGKPQGVSHLLLFGAFGDKPLGLEHARFIGAYTRSPFEVNYPLQSGVEGKVATYYGRWLTGRGDVGPWSPGVSMIVARACAGVEQVTFGYLFGLDAPAPPEMDTDATGAVRVIPPEALPSGADDARSNTPRSAAALAATAADASEARRVVETKYVLVPAREVAE